MTEAGPTINSLSAKFDDEYPEHAAEWVANQAVQSIQPKERTRLLVELVASRIRDRRRERARTVEQASTSPLDVLASEHNRLVREEANAELGELLADHSKRAFCDWEHTSAGAVRQCEQKLGRTGELEKRRLWNTDRAEYDRRFPSPFKQFQQAIDNYRNSVRLELTLELMTTSFALGDGRKVTWGSARDEDHAQRIEMLRQQATGSVQTMILHEKARELLFESGADCLNDVRADSKKGLRAKGMPLFMTGDGQAAVDRITGGPARIVEA